uniref:Uncharacterized protein n=1 Tax=Timema tahoe TaxID=61484 RepID=A0A7R9IM89_9NEOP|nr:unnamed protein product [Timema tahoe]
MGPLDLGGTQGTDTKNDDTRTRSGLTTTSLLRTIRGNPPRGALIGDRGGFPSGGVANLPSTPPPSYDTSRAIRICTNYVDVLGIRKEHDFVEILSPPRRKSVRSPICKTHVDALAHDPRNNIVVQRVEGGGWRVEDRGRVQQITNTMPLLSTDEVIVNVGVVVVSGVPTPPQSLPGQEQEEPSTPEKVRDLEQRVVCSQGRETRSGSEGGESSVSSHVAEGVFPSLPDGALLQLGLLPVNERSIRWVPVMSKISAPALALINRSQYIQTYYPLPVDIVCRKLDSLDLMTGIEDYNR